MNNYYDNVILSDCDGVFLNWNFGFEQWMKSKGYSIKNPNEYDISLKYGVDDSKYWVERFNESAAAGYLPPYKDGVKYVKKLHQEHGMVFKIISSFSNDPLSQKLRIKNLKRHYGEGVFQSYEFLGTGANKYETLKQNQGPSFWLEDHYGNAMDGMELGFSSVLFTHDYNRNKIFDSSNGLRVENWKEFYETYFQ